MTELDNGYLEDQEGVGAELVEAIASRLDRNEKVKIPAKMPDFTIEKLILASNKNGWEFMELERVVFDGETVYELHHLLNSSLGLRTSFYLVIEEDGRVRIDSTRGEPGLIFDSEDTLKLVLEAINGPDEWSSVERFEI